VTRTVGGDEIRRVLSETHLGAHEVLERHPSRLDALAPILVRRATLERDPFLALLDGRMEADVVGDDDPLEPTAPVADPPAPASIARPGPIVPRPGLAVDMTVLGRRPGERW
jgi:hypothetical protein